MPSPSSYSPLPLTLTKLIFLGTLTWLTMPPDIVREAEVSQMLKV